MPLSVALNQLNTVNRGDIMNLYEIDKLINTLDEDKDKEIIEFYLKKRIELIKQIKTSLQKHHKNMINWYKEVDPSLGDLMHELDYLKIDLSVDDFKMIMDY